MNSAAVLPALRQELELIEGPTGAAGSPTWLIHDPVRNQYFQFDWVSCELLTCWGRLAPAQLLERVQERGRVLASQADLDFLLDFLRRHRLLEPGSGSAAQWARERKQVAGSVWAWLLHNYLFFRIPLLKPNGFLNRTSAWMAGLFTAGFAWATLGAGLLGLVGVGRQWDLFTHTLVDYFSWQGMLAYLLTLAVVKVLHEFGHAYTAKRFGCQVPTMGLAFMVLWPVLYTDTNDVWRLKSNKRRLAVSSAGVITELGIALWATFFWVLVSDGLLRNMLFLLATTTWVSTVLINVSPFMRFDGYFMLMDALRFPNLHARSFAFARWHLRKLLLGLNDPVPETFAPRQQLLLIVFAWATWVYRLILFLGIALLVYQFFIKLVGLFLFLVEIVWFVAKPLASELAVWRKRWVDVTAIRRIALWGMALGLLALLAVVPVPGRVQASAVVMPEQMHTVYAPRGAMLMAAMPDDKPGRQDEAIFVFDAPELNSQRQVNQAQQESARWQSGVATMSPDMRGQWESLSAQTAVTRAQGQLIGSDLKNYRVSAPFDGRLQVLDPDLRPGQWLHSGEKLGHWTSSAGVRVIAYLTENEVARLQSGRSARFIPDSGVGPTLELVVDVIHSDRVRVLAEPELAVNFGGSVIVREQKGQLFPEGSYYRVELVPRERIDFSELTRFRWRGRIYVSATPEPLLASVFTTLASALIRETGF